MAGAGAFWTGDGTGAGNGNAGGTIGAAAELDRLSPGFDFTAFVCRRAPAGLGDDTAGTGGTLSTLASASAPGTPWLSLPCGCVSFNVAIVDGTCPGNIHNGGASVCKEEPVLLPLCFASAGASSVSVVSDSDVPDFGPKRLNDKLAGKGRLSVCDAGCGFQFCRAVFTGSASFLAAG